MKGIINTIGHGEPGPKGDRGDIGIPGAQVSFFFNKTV